MTLGPVPTSSILAYAEKIDGVTDPRELRFYLRMVRVVEAERLRAERER